MVIVLNSQDSNKNRQHRQLIPIESSEHPLEKKSKQEIDQTWQNWHPSLKDIHVEVADNYLPIFGKKARAFFSVKNKQRLQDTKDGIIHIGNINGCIRQSMITEQYNDQLEYNIWDLCNFMDGLDSEKIIVKILDHGRSNVDEKGEFQKNIEFDNFVAHPDYIDDETAFIFELKSTNKTKPFILSDDTMKVYIRQIVYYMVLNDMEKGRIFARYALPFFPEYIGKDVDTQTGVEEPIYKHRYHKDTGQFPFFACELEIKVDAPSRERIKKGLVEIVKPAYLAGDITQIPVLDGKAEGKNWKCNSYCKVKDICDTIPDLQTDQNKRYILLNKHIDDATDKVRKYGKRGDKNVEF